tara:strand:- start:82 stop:336 length:255 start_codon:yes stop_codon:yes gene_type:complete
MTEQNLKWIIDDAHGWLRVDKLKYIRSNFRASPYSYYDDQYVYLEEDCDASLYINEHKVINDIPVQMINGLSQIRNLDHISIGN